LANTRSFGVQRFISGTGGALTVRDASETGTGAVDACGSIIIGAIVAVT